MFTSNIHSQVVQAENFNVVSDASVLVVVVAVVVAVVVVSLCC